MAGFTLKIGADASGYKNELNKMRAQTNAFSSKIGGIMKGAFALLSVGAVRDIAREFTEMGMAAKTLGMDTKEFTKFAQAAASYGLDVNQVEDAFKDLNVKLQEAVAGNKGYQESFNAMGLDYAAAAIARPAEQMYLFGDALQKIGDDQQARMRMDEINDAMWRMSPLILRSRKEAEKFVNQFKGLSEDEIGSIIEGEAAWKRVVTMLKIELVPLLRLIADTISGATLFATDPKEFMRKKKEAATSRVERPELASLSQLVSPQDRADMIQRLKNEEVIKANKENRPLVVMPADVVNAIKETAENTRQKPSKPVMPE